MKFLVYKLCKTNAPYSEVIKNRVLWHKLIETIDNYKQWQLKDYSKDGKKLKTLRFHDFRSTYATRLDKHGVRLKVIQNLLRHKHLFSTQRYLRNSSMEERVIAVNDVFNLSLPN